MVNTVEQLVDALGGTSAAAGLVGIDKRVVSNWKARGRIPAGYFLVLSQLLGETPDPAIFGVKSPAETV